MFQLKSFEEFKRELKPLPYTMRQYTHEEFCKKICPIIRQCIANLLNPTEEEKKRRQQSLKQMDDIIFEWEVVLNHE